MAQADTVAQLEQELDAPGRADAPNGHSGSEGAQKALRDLRADHVKLLEAVVNAVAPATESDPLGEYGGRESALSEGSENTRELLTRLAALVSSLVRSVITPLSVLPLPRPPFDGLTPSAFPGGGDLAAAAAKSAANARLGGWVVGLKMRGL